MDAPPPPIVIRGAWGKRYDRSILQLEPGQSDAMLGSSMYETATAVI